MKKKFEKFEEKNFEEKKLKKLNFWRKKCWNKFLEKKCWKQNLSKQFFFEKQKKLKTNWKKSKKNWRKKNLEKKLEK